MAKEGQIAVIHYTARLVDGPESGAIVDTTDVDVAQRESIYHNHRDYKPLEFRVGDGGVAPVLEDAVTDLETGETRTEVAEPERAFGEYDEDDVHELDTEAVEELVGEVPTEDSLVTTADNRTGWVTAVDDNRVVLDFNHELAGERLEVEVRLLDVYGEPGDDSPKTWEKKYGKRQSD
ncbi:FKBP-type peptidyl-prolyl cis-trans isomerase [Natronorubrum sulfidifaciens]|uniref:Peptidyl-prolyl cis-trans isomerase n=1 Tax=Natronorubrum sulfidifaciens JCM 14089 TaxID=1230460 RepID=L9WE67_9EURY|nr:FKBP-type peptidyl-prolyl cis-trans isomerase [Natronorubrum sulfidifaciens]ELY47546.1 FKBP-type peptidylprolyl isomerase [Natronorubrum sulfidifaciens JCM 14089]